MTKFISQDTFEALCKIQCTRDEMCSVLCVDHKTLNKWCKTTYGKTLELVMADYQAEGKASFRRMGIKLAEKNPSVWIFLAKNWLGMSDNPAPISTGEESKELAKAISSASRAMAKMDVSTLASIPDTGRADG